MGRLDALVQQDGEHSVFLFSSISELVGIAGQLLQGVQHFEASRDRKYLLSGVVIITGPLLAVNST